MCITWKKLLRRVSLRTWYVDHSEYLTKLLG
jgi:hypothetical protein